VTGFDSRYGLPGHGGHSGQLLLGQATGLPGQP
jgi:hypothetical protein